MLDPNPESTMVPSLWLPVKRLCEILVNSVELCTVFPFSRIMVLIPLKVAPVSISGRNCTFFRNSRALHVGVASSLYRGPAAGESLFWDRLL